MSDDDTGLQLDIDEQYLDMVLIQRLFHHGLKVDRRLTRIESILNTSGTPEGLMDIQELQTKLDALGTNLTAKQSELDDKVAALEAAKAAGADIPDDVLSGIQSAVAGISAGIDGIPTSGDTTTTPPVTDPTTPTDPAAPSDPTTPADPTAPPTDPGTPADPTAPVDTPTDPSAPVDTPTDPAAPADPTTPVDPGAPVDTPPADPTAPDAPAPDPGTPVDTEPPAAGVDDGSGNI